jgi:hypothetical protein
MKSFPIFSLLTLFFFSNLSSGFAADLQPAQMAKAIGWLIVKFDADDVYDRSTQHSIDEIVCPLVRAGIDTDAMVWMKPSYGNQNLLYFSTDKLFAEKELKQIKQNAPKAVPPWFVKESTEIIESKTFHAVETSLPGEAFTYAMYMCDGKQSHLIYYWGTESAQHRDELEKLLKIVANRCR